MKIIENTIVQGAVELLFPRHCPVCDQPVKWKTLICPECLVKLKRVEEPYCMRCGKPLSDSGQEYCGDCRRGKALYLAGRALYEYDSAAASIYRFKYGGRQEYAAFFGRQMAEAFGGFLEQTKTEGLLPVPLSKQRFSGRGYNQAALLAREIGKQTSLPVYENLASRVRDTLPQKILKPHERQNNLKKAFKIAQNDVKLSTITIVDDIYTTGSTVNALAEILRASGVESVYFISLSVGSGG